MYLTNNLVNFFKAGDFKMVFRIIDKIGMSEKPCLKELWCELMELIDYQLRNNKHIEKLTVNEICLINRFFDTNYFNTCSSLSIYSYEPYLKFCCQRLVELKSDVFIKDFFDSALFQNDFKHKDIYIMIDAGIPIEYIETYINLAKRLWGEKPMHNIHDILLGYSDSDGSIKKKGEELIHIVFKDNPNCPSYDYCTEKLYYGNEANLKIFKRICEIYYKTNEKNFEEEFNAK